MKSRYSISANIKEFADDYQALEGFDLIDIKYANGVWFGAYGDGIGKKSPSDSLVTAWNSQPTFSGLQTKIAEREADGYKLTDIEVTPGGYWLGIFSNKQSKSEYITARTGADFDRQVRALQAEDANFALGYEVVDIEYADGLWVGVLDRNGSDATYTTLDSYREFEQEVASQRKAGLELTNLEYNDGLWTTVFTDELTGLSVYSPKPHDDIKDFQAEINSFSRQGYDLINIESIEGDWFGIYKENIYLDDPLTSSPNTSQDTRDTVSILRAGQVPGDVSVAIGNAF